MIAIGTKAQIEALELKSRKKPTKRWANPQPFGAKFWIQVLPFSCSHCKNMPIDDILNDSELHYLNESHFRVLRASLDDIDAPEPTPQVREIDFDEPEPMPEITPENEVDTSDSEVTPDIFDFTVIPKIGEVAQQKIVENGIYTADELREIVIGSDTITAANFLGLSLIQIDAIKDYFDID